MPLHARSCICLHVQTRSEIQVCVRVCVFIGRGKGSTRSPSSSTGADHCQHEGTIRKQ